MSGCEIPSVDENNPLYCPEFPKSTYLKVVNQCLALRRGYRNLDFAAQSQPLNNQLLSESSEHILGEFLSGNICPISADLPPYSVTDPSWSPSLHNGSTNGPLHDARLKPFDSFSDLFAPPQYARSVLSAHDSPFEVEVRPERLRFFEVPSSPEEKTATNVNMHFTDGVDYLVHQLALAVPGIRLDERLKALKPLTPQTIMDFLVHNGHLNMRTLDTLRLSDVGKIIFPRSFFNSENGLNLRGNEIFSVFGKPDGFRCLTKLSFSGTCLLDSDIVHFHHLPRLSILLLDETGITNEAYVGI